MFPPVSFPLKKGGLGPSVAQSYGIQIPAHQVGGPKFYAISGFMHNVSHGSALMGYVG